MAGGRRRLGAAVVALATVLAGCGSSASTSAVSAGSGHGSRGSGRTVSVLYAGSLVNLMEHDLGPAFQHADGYGFEGFGAGSTALVAQIKSKIRRGDVFISASPTANADLEGAANGSYVSWFAEFAKAPLVIGYDPHSRFAKAFRHRPWYQVIGQPGIRVGRTDPKLDPKGKLTVKAIDEAVSTLHRPALSHALSAAAVFPEESLVGRLEAGQLDAGFFYANEAAEQHLPTVSLAPVSASAKYTVTILRGSTDAEGAAAFVKFLLGPTGRAMLARHGITVLAPELAGAASAVPPELRALVGG
jgi:molybdate/tungstate transport system substrate-binding protein